MHSNGYIIGTNTEIMNAVGPVVDVQIYKKSSCKLLFDFFALTT